MMTPSDLDFIILAGGRGTRATHLRPGTPKFLAPFGGQAFAAIYLRELEAAGLRRAILAVSRPFGAEAISLWMLANWEGKMALFSVIEEEPKGVAGAVRGASGFAQSDPVLVLNGDTLWDGLTPTVVQELILAYENAGPVVVSSEGIDAGIYLVPRDDPDLSDCHRIELGVSFWDIGTPEGYTAALRARGISTIMRP